MKERDMKERDINERDVKNRVENMEFTGERYVPEVHGQIELEHLHRYLQACRVVAGKVVLDLACGEGYGSAMLARGAGKVIGVDISAEAVKHARKRYKRENLEFMVGSCSDIPLPDGSVDMVVSFETIEHHDQHSQMMQEVKRVLRPAGILLISSPDKYHYSVEPSRANPYHVKELYQHEFKQLLERYFKNIAYFGQRVLYGSGILQESLQLPLVNYLQEDGIIRESSGIISPDYWIAFASDGRLPDLVSSVFEIGETGETADRQNERIHTLDSLIGSASFTPGSLQFPNAWVGHLPFAAWLIQQVSPKIFVELGTHSGNSYFSFCQAVVAAGLSSKCYAVDTWQGDEHAGRYGEEVFAAVSAYHQEHFADFSRLLRMTFDEAAGCFSDESIDLLHIDGLHSYGGVRHDFERWAPKLAPGAVVIFHDTNVREKGFGVWRLWEELQARYPATLEFLHSHGLGVLQLDNAPDDKKLEWLQPDSPEKLKLVNYFGALGSQQLKRYELNELKHSLNSLNQALAGRDGLVASLNKALAVRDSEIVQMRSSYPWRITLALREMRRWITAPFHRRRGYIKAERPDLSSLFDVRWYLETYPDVRAAGIDPLEHFIRAGWMEGCNPHPLFDVKWYLETYPDVRAAGLNPLEHFIHAGWMEGRNPHPLFDVKWYLETYPDVRVAGMNPLSHYVEFGAAELRNPNPDFDAMSFVAEHPDAAANPLIYYAQHGTLEGLRTHRSIDIAGYLPQIGTKHAPSLEVTVDIIVPVYRGLNETRRCLESVLSDKDRPPGSIRVIDDCSPEPELSAWLSSLAASGQIELSRNRTNLGFVKTANRGMTDAGRHDVVLLNSDTEVPSGFLRRLIAHAYSAPKVASVTPLSNRGGEFCNYPTLTITGGPLPKGYSLEEIDDACRTANGLRKVEIPTGVGFCMYIRRDCLDEVGLFDSDAFGHGYGEETDFCQRALAAGWHHLLACDTFVYHVGEVSFGENAPERSRSWNILVDRYPQLPALLARHLASAPRIPVIFSATVSLFMASPLPTILMLNHNLNGSTTRHVDELVNQVIDSANVLLLCSKGPHFELSVPSLPGHPTLRFPNTALGELASFLRACAISRVHIQHWIGFGADLHELVNQLGVPLELTVHDTFSI